MTLAEKARAAGCDARTIELAYMDIVEGRWERNVHIMDAHERMCLYALCHDNPVGNVRFPLFAAGIVRE